MRGKSPGPPGRRHPGAGRRRGRQRPRGRPLDPAAQEAIAALLGDRPRRADLLIEYLHLVQDNFRCLSLDHLNALAEELGLPAAHVYEVATFYAHFDVVEDSATAPAVTVRVCDSLTCELMGGTEVLDELKTRAGDDVRVVRAPCMGRCDRAPIAQVGHHYVDEASSGSVLAAVTAGRTGPDIPASIDLAAYEADGGYRVLRSCRDGSRSLDSVLERLDTQGLKGLGGAGFPTARKWRIVRGYPGERLMAVNADEGEPGTFKDRLYLETDPHRFLEGMLIAAWAVEARDVYVYLRDEYPGIRHVLERELAALAAAGLTGSTRIHLRRGAGAYICGEESAMIESIEGKRGLPRHRPPYVAEQGLFGRPTLVQNVETLYWVRDIVDDSGEWADVVSATGRPLRSYSVSGRVREPGVKRAPAGVTAEQLIDDYCGGMQPGHTLKAYLPGGASGGILPAELANLPLDFGTLDQYGCFVGSHAVIVLSHQDSVKAAALNLMRFFEDESCGQCTPCRVGTEKAVALMAKSRWDRKLLEDLATVMADASICGLGQAAPNPLRCAMTYFPEEFE